MASASESVFDKFRDFDDPDCYAAAVQHARDEKSKNFVVYFGYGAAQIAFDVTAQDVSSILAAPERTSYPIRWINLWTPDGQEDIIKRIGDHYYFSRRLQRSMIDTGTKRPENKPAAAAKAKPVESEKADDANKDLERGLNGNSKSAATGGGTPARSSDFGMHDLFRENMNYTSIDRGSHFICVGANWLHNRPKIPDDQSRHLEETLVPPRHWSWLALCSDHTVITVQAAPSYEQAPEGVDEAVWQKKELQKMRRNVKSAVLQLSKCGYNKYENKIVRIKLVRPALGGSGDDGTLSRAGSTLTVPPANDVAIEGSSNLFYYLFEDYEAALPILRKSKKRLDELTKEVLNSGMKLSSLRRRRKDLRKMRTIPDLHKLSKDLRQLKHLFEGTKALIQKIRTPRNSDMMASRQQLQVAGDVVLSSTALDRFERLEDRLQLLMLNRIQEYLEEQKALSDTYFNLTAQRDSEATARLNRNAALLAKLSVFFLPLGLMTSYFSVQIPDLTDHYNGRTYWITFAVLASISFICIFFIDRLLMRWSEVMSDAVDMTEIYLRRKLNLKHEDEHDEE